MKKLNAMMMNAISDVILHDAGCIQKETVLEFMDLFQMSEKEAVLELLAANLGFDFVEHPEHRALFHRVFGQNFELLDSSIINDDEYMKCIRKKKMKYGAFQMEWLEFKPYELMFIDDVQTEQDGVLRISVGCFRESVSYPMLFENGVEWMSVVPSEINTMRPCLEKMHGKILVLGLGMGYFVYHASQKQDVKNICAIEISKDLIEWFQSEVMNEFEQKEKIQLIHMDALQALETLDLNEFDCVFADIWHNGLDGAKWVKQFEPVLKKYPHITWVNWLNSSIESILLDDEENS